MQQGLLFASAQFSTAKNSFRSEHLFDNQDHKLIYEKYIQNIHTVGLTFASTLKYIMIGEYVKISFLPNYSRIKY